jgi:hypothetical protein
MDREKAPPVKTHLFFTMREVLQVLTGLSHGTRIGAAPAIH